MKPEVEEIIKAFLKPDNKEETLKLFKDSNVGFNEVMGEYVKAYDAKTAMELFKVLT